MAAAAAPLPLRLPHDDATNGWSAILPPRTPRPAPQVHGVAGCNGAGVVKFTALGALAADLALGQDNPLLAHALALGGPTRMPPQPVMGLGVRAYIAREKWLGRAEV